jgi:hypothetical protein
MFAEKVRSRATLCVEAIVDVFRAFVRHPATCFPADTTAYKIHRIRAGIALGWSQGTESCPSNRVPTDSWICRHQRHDSGFRKCACTSFAVPVKPEKESTLAELVWKLPGIVAALAAAFAGAFPASAGRSIDARWINVTRAVATTTSHTPGSTATQTGVRHAFAFYLEKGFPLALEALDTSLASAVRAPPWATFFSLSPCLNYPVSTNRDNRCSNRNGSLLLPE